MKCPICGSYNLKDDFLADQEILDDKVRITLAVHCDDCKTKLMITQTYLLPPPFDTEIEIME